MGGGERGGRDGRGEGVLLTGDEFEAGDFVLKLDNPLLWV
jgi:hypothetical protein